jgi:hypothetical protein
MDVKERVFEVDFGREYYSKHEQIIQWCRDNIGPGSWSGSRSYEDWLKTCPDELWTVYLMFGYTHIACKREEDCSKLILAWKWTEKEDM